ncbi:MAG: glycosyltransferase family 2 protein [Candidatus Peribacteraceae bacterium]|nr:glycosyltransferase family 2 protein [Candidatus Peribacteraceae bacterium]
MFLPGAGRSRILCLSPAARKGIGYHLGVPALSVVIPTHRRPELLARSLRHLAAQTVAADLEVIVVSDGPDDNAKQSAACVTVGGRAVRFLEIPKCQQGVARNRGVELATAPLTLFCQDDIFLDPHACATHLAAHAAHPGALVLGFTTWDPACGVTPVMEWLEATGWQFGYPQLAPYAHGPVPAAIQHRYTYTSHLSLPTELAKRVAFREDVTLYGWEDIEWGLRLARTGAPLIYEPDAKALHHHHLELADSLKRMETIGRSAVHIESIAPELHVTPRGWKAWAYVVLSWLPTMRGRHSWAFRKGLMSGLANNS